MEGNIEAIKREKVSVRLVGSNDLKQELEVMDAQGMDISYPVLNSIAITDAEFDEMRRLINQHKESRKVSNIRGMKEARSELGAIFDQYIDED
jgi:hypothetical protein